MPTYVYACDSCGNQFEQFQSFKDDPLTSCVCGSEGSVRRVFQPVGIVFKGSGWYITDSRNTGSEKTSDKASEKTTDKQAEANGKTAKTDKTDSAGTAESSESTTPSDKSSESTTPSTTTPGTSEQKTAA